MEFMSGIRCRFIELFCISMCRLMTFWSLLGTTMYPFSTTQSIATLEVRYQRQSHQSPVHRLYNSRTSNGDPFSFCDFLGKKPRINKHKFRAGICWLSDQPIRGGVDQPASSILATIGYTPLWGNLPEIPRPKIRFLQSLKNLILVRL